MILPIATELRYEVVMAKQDSNFFDEDEQDLYEENAVATIEGEDPELASFFAQERRQENEKNKRSVKRRIEMQIEKRQLMKNIEYYDWD